MRWACVSVYVLVGLSTEAALADVSPLRPTSSTFDYLQYGVAFAAEMVASPGDVCRDERLAPCILGPGFGPAIGVGYRGPGRWYAGGVYEFSRQDSSNLMRLAILQQIRGELRYYFDSGQRLTPYALGGLGAVFYGNEWGTDTGGLGLNLGAGFEFQVSERAVVGTALTYRALLLRGWDDDAGQRRADRYFGFGLAHLIALELVWEIREPLARW